MSPPGGPAPQSTPFRSLIVAAALLAAVGCGSRRVSLPGGQGTPFAEFERCSQMVEGVVLTHSNRGGVDGAPVIRETVSRLPCLVDPPSAWRLLYRGYPERVFQIDPERTDASN